GYAVCTGHPQRRRLSPGTRDEKAAQHQWLWVRSLWNRRTRWKNWRSARQEGVRRRIGIGSVMKCWSRSFPVGGANSANRLKWKAVTHLAIKVKVPRIAVRATRRNVLIVAAGVCAIGLLVGVSIFLWYWNKYGEIVNDRLKEPLFVHTAQIYAAPPE